VSERSHSDAQNHRTGTERRQRLSTLRRFQNGCTPRCASTPLPEGSMGGQSAVAASRGPSPPTLGLIPGRVPGLPAGSDGFHRWFRQKNGYSGLTGGRIIEPGGYIREAQARVQEDPPMSTRGMRKWLGAGLLLGAEVLVSLPNAHAANARSRSMARLGRVCRVGPSATIDGPSSTPRGFMTFGNQLGETVSDRARCTVEGHRDPPQTPKHSPPSENTPFRGDGISRQSRCPKTQTGLGLGPALRNRNRASDANPDMVQTRE